MMIQDRPSGRRLEKPWTGLLAVALLALVSPTAATATPTVRIDPPSVITGPGNEFNVSVRINADADTFSNFQIVFQFDPAVIEFVEAFEGSLYSNNPLYHEWFHVEEESTGTVEVFEVIFPGWSFVVAPGELTVLRFRALVEGFSTIDFLSVTVTDILRVPLDPLFWENGIVFVTPATGVASSSRPAAWELSPPRPNPARGATRVFLRPAAQGPAGGERLAVYDLRGRLVRLLCDGASCAGGWVAWDGRDERAVAVAAGTYFLRLESGDGVVTRKVVLLP